MRMYIAIAMKIAQRKIRGLILLNTEGQVSDRGFGQ